MYRLVFEKIDRRLKWSPEYPAENPADVLIVGEGIETCLAVTQAADIATWAALSTSGMKALQLPGLPLAGTVVIAVDSDDPGIEAAEVAAARFTREGLEVRIARPPHGLDFNDVLLLPEKVALFCARKKATHG